jgi:LacI family transcriptional regulator
MREKGGVKRTKKAPSLPPRRTAASKMPRRTAARVTLRDIAAATGFTMNTVSRALKGKSDISARTRRLIQQEARRMGYIPDALAASLRSGTTRTVSVIIPDISDPLFAILVRDIEARLKEKDFDLFIQNTDEDGELERRAVLAAIGKRIDGIIICPCQKSVANLALMRDNGIPFVLLCRRFARGTFNYVVADDVKGGFLATEHLIQRGHSDILFLNGPRQISSARERLLGYRRALEKHGLAYRGSLVREVKIRAGECSRALQELLEQKVHFTAIFCFSDLMAWEAISVLQPAGLNIPRDVAIVGFDDIQSRLYYPYPLTSIGYGKKRIADTAVDTLMEKIETPARATRVRAAIDVELVERKSSEGTRLDLTNEH